MSDSTPIQSEFQFPEVKLCECGCGQPAPIATITDRKRGVVKGNPQRFVRGHHARLRVFPPTEERFWAKVDISGGPDACWLWMGAIGKNGYGHISHHGHICTASRVSWELHFGPIPHNDSYHGLCVCHKCDSRNCVNPTHLFLGTNQDNMNDMVTKNRSNKAKGEFHAKATLRDCQVKEIRERVTAGERQIDIAREYGVEKGTISRIILRKTWRHIP